MEVDNCIRSRRSIRDYRNVPVKLSDIAHILDSAVYAPSSGNIQNWRFVVVSNKELKYNISKACFDQDWMNTAPVFIVICNDGEVVERMYGNPGKKYSLINCVAVAQNILLKAHSIGLASCWICAFDQDLIGQFLGIPKKVIPESIITLGYSNVKKPVVPKRHDIHEYTFFNNYGNTKMDSSHFLKAQEIKESKKEEIVEKEEEKTGKLKKFVSKFIEKDESGFLP